MDDALESDGEPIGTGTVLAVIAATMIGFAAVVAVLAVGVLDDETTGLPEIRDDGTGGDGIPNADPTGFEGETNASEDSRVNPDGAGNGSTIDRRSPVSPGLDPSRVSGRS
ncbi:hypothetical protein [Saliphagus infecundisoli]|uniref:Flagellin N-terminal-like domain-containing protein n=1 Tax=Saliphagus infecundisoli TaxID=1849069 RepID=A0ABD5QFU9_9EURY|nr:hypothetical protein [Saliphagus infecundisoli]